MDSAEAGDNSKEPVTEDLDRDGIKDAQGATEDATKDDDKKDNSDIKEEVKEKSDNNNPGVKEKLDKNNPDKPDDITFYTGVPLTTMPGHTGYLTFATLSGQVKKWSGASP